MSLKEAIAFINHARDVQRQSNKKQSGAKGLNPEQHRRINEICADRAPFWKEFSKCSGIEAYHSLLIDFEEMCRRNDLTLPEQSRKDIALILSHELWRNLKALNVKPYYYKRIASLTKYQGTSFVDSLKPDKFPFFQSSEDAFLVAATKHPSDPQGFLEEAEKKYLWLLNEKEFEEFHNNPALLKYAVINYPKNTLGFLRNTQKTVKELLSEEEFKVFHDRLGLLREIVIKNQRNPQETLRKAVKNYNKLINDPEFVDFADTPGIIKLAVVSNPKNPKAFLEEKRKDSLSTIKSPSLTTSPEPV